MGHKYMLTKVEKMGHLLDVGKIEDEQATAETGSE